MPAFARRSRRSMSRARTASRWSGRRGLAVPLPGRVNGTDLMFELLAAARERRLGLYVLGARQELLEAAACENPRRLSGHSSGRLSKWVLRRVREADRGCADRGFRSRLAARRASSPKRSGSWSSMRGISGLIRDGGGRIDRTSRGRIPEHQWMQRTGLGGSFGVVQEPRRMWRRYLRTNTRFVVLLAKALVMRSKARRADRYAAPRASIPLNALILEWAFGSRERHRSSGTHTEQAGFGRLPATLLRGTG